MGTQVNKKYIDLTTGTNGVNGQSILANKTATNYTPSDTYIKGHLDGIDTVLGSVVSNPNDIAETSFSATNNQSSAANVTGFAFANANVRSFKAMVSVYRDATIDVFEAFELQGIQKGSGWDMAYTSVGDNSGIVFTITTAGQIQYTSTNLSGHVSSTIKFRAWSTSV